MSNKETTHKYDIKELEDKVHEAYVALKEIDDAGTRTEFFETVWTLTRVILEVTTDDPVLGKVEDIKEVSYDYAVNLFERIITGTFVPEVREGYTKIPWTRYIKLSLRSVIFSKLNESELTKLFGDARFIFEYEEDILDGKYVSDNTIENTAARSFLAKILFKKLRMFYSKKEIKRLFPIASDLFYIQKQKIISLKLPKDVRDFSIVLLALAKRLIVSEGYRVSEGSIEHLRDALKSVVKSTIFLATVSNSRIFPLPLLLSLDVDSLYRLVTVAGGKTIKVPSMRDLESLIGGVLSAGKMMLDGKDVDKALKEVKKEYGLVMANTINIHDFINNILECVKREEVAGEPLVEVVLSSMRSLEKLFDTVVDSCDKLSGDAILHHYTELNKLLTNVTGSLVKVTEG
jgi:hypothetical protein